MKKHNQIKSVEDKFLLRMAQVDDTPDESTGGGFAKLETIDINDTSLEDGKAQKINPDADAWERTAPPPDGIYAVKVFLAKVEFQAGWTNLDEKTKQKTERSERYIVANLELKILENEKWNGTTLFGKVSTYIAPSREISTMVGLLKKMGMKLNAADTPKTPKEWAATFKKILGKNEPIVYVEGEWKAFDMHKFEWIAQGMKNFPKTPDGFNHVVRDSKGGQVTAKFKINKWLSKVEYKELMEREAKRKLNTTQSAKQQGGGKQGESVSENEGFQPVNASIANSSGVDDSDFVLE